MLLDVGVLTASHRQVCLHSKAHPQNGHTKLSPTPPRFLLESPPFPSFTPLPSPPSTHSTPSTSPSPGSMTSATRGVKWKSSRNLVVVSPLMKRGSRTSSRRNSTLLGTPLSTVPVAGWLVVVGRARDDEEGRAQHSVEERVPLLTLSATNSLQPALAGIHPHTQTRLPPYLLHQPPQPLNGPTFTQTQTPNKHPHPPSLPPYLRVPPGSWPPPPRVLVRAPSACPAVSRSRG